MSEKRHRGATSRAAADAPACRRLSPDTYRCACGRVRDRCVRANVHALWSVDALTPARPAPS